jgi:hypothetical protein
VKLEGFAVPYDTWCWHDHYQGFSMFARGAFSEAIAGGLIRLNVHHQQAHTLAAQDTSNLRCWETREGLMFEADIAPSPLATFVEHAIGHGFASNICAVVVSHGHDEPTAPGEPRRITQTRVLGCDLAILIANRGHYPTTWIRVV